MTVLTAAQDAMAVLVGRRPAAVVSSQNEMEVEITNIAQEAAVEIMKSHDWQNLTEFYTLTGTGEETYPLPADYDRMVQASEVYDPNSWAWGYEHINDYGVWLTQISRGFYAAPGAWMIRKNLFHFAPGPSIGQEAVFPYISKNIFTDANGSPKARITNDTDSFILDERLLKLSIIWRWLALKKMDFTEELRTYENALSQEQVRDGGARVIRRNSRRVPSGVRPGWPWPLGGGA